MTPQRPDLLWLLNQYREAELRGADVILRLLRLADSTRLRRDLTRHLQDEATHAWLWTSAIESLGGELVAVPDPYQQMLGSHFGLPTTLTELLALTLVSERRGVAEYKTLATGDVAAPVAAALRRILKDEQWHVHYIAAALDERAGCDPAVHDAIARAEAADRATMADLEASRGR